MTRTRKIVTISAASIAGLIVLLLLAAVVVMQTGWFRNYVRDKIIATTEESTGGKVEIGSFDFDLWHLRATIHNFVLHGTEPANVPPLLQGRMLQVDLRLFSGLKQALDLRSLIIDQPKANIIVNADGSTNVPAPKVKQPDNTSALETVVDLAIGHFELRNGSLLFADRPLPLDARGENLRATLDFNRVTQSYKGQIAMAPLYVNYAKNQPQNINVTLPVTLERDRITVADARVATPLSEVTLNGTVEHLLSPRISGHASARVAVQELEQATGMKLAQGKDLPGAATADLNFSMAGDRIQVSAAHLALGDSTVEASGTLKDPGGNPPGLEFRSHLALGQLGRLFQVPARPEGVVNANGTAKLSGASGYQVAGNIQGQGLSFTQGGQRFSNINLASAVAADQNKIALEGLRLDALGGEFAGNASLENLSRFELSGNLRHFDLNTLARTFTGKPLGYAGSISGPVKAGGNLKAPGTSGIEATAQLAIAPGGNGVPVSGRINAQYNGAKDTVQLANSFVALPHSRVELSGALGQQLSVNLRSTNLNDFLPAMRAGSKEPVSELPVALQQQGLATFSGTVTGPLASPQLRGHVAVNNFSVEGRSFDQLAADVAASKSAPRSRTRGSRAAACRFKPTRGSASTTGKRCLRKL